MKKVPKVSIILPTFNGQKFISQSIKSVLSQTFSDFELIIINDGSTDETEKKILELANRDERIVYIKNKVNLKLISTLNKGLSVAKGDLIARIDDDDEWIDKNKLRKQIKAFEADPELGLIGTNTKIVDINGNLIKYTQLNLTDHQIKSQIIFNNQFIHSSVMFKKRIINLLGKYKMSPFTMLVEDYELWLRIGSKFKLMNLKDICVLYRRNEKGESFNNFYLQKINGLRVSIQYSKYYPNSQIGILGRSIRLLIPKQLSYILQSI